jgi:hypothetical protein
VVDEERHALVAVGQEGALGEEVLQREVGGVAAVAVDEDVRGVGVHLDAFQEVALRNDDSSVGDLRISEYERDLLSGDRSQLEEAAKRGNMFRGVGIRVNVHCCGEVPPA